MKKSRVEIFCSANSEKVLTACQSLRDMMNEWLNGCADIAVIDVGVDTPKRIVDSRCTWWFMTGHIRYEEVTESNKLAARMTPRVKLFVTQQWNNAEHACAVLEQDMNRWMQSYQADITVRRVSVGQPRYHDTYWYAHGAITFDGRDSVDYDDLKPYGQS